MAIHEHPIYLPLEEGEILWRYMSLEKFESLLSNRALFFCRADKFPDVYEGSIPKREADFRMKAERDACAFYKTEFNEEEALRRIYDRSELHRKFKRATTVNCWHINNNESDGMWRLYLKNNEGIALQTNATKLYECIAQLPQQIEMSKVRYLDYETDIWYHRDHFPYTSYNMITPLMHKRIEFKHESEFRLFILNNDAIDDINYWGDTSGAFLHIDVQSLVDKLIIHPSADDAVLGKLESIMAKYQMKFGYEKSKLSIEPIY